MYSTKPLLLYMQCHENNYCGGMAAMADLAIVHGMKACHTYNLSL